MFDGYGTIMNPIHMKLSFRIFNANRPVSNEWKIAIGRTRIINS